MGAGLAARRLAGPPGALRPRRAPDQGVTAPEEGRRDRDLPPLPPVGRRARSSRPHARARRRAATTSSSTRRLGQVEHHRLDWPTGSSTLHDDADTQGLRQGRRHHRPAWCSTTSSRTRSTSSSTPGASSRRSTRTPSSSPRPWPASRRGSSSPPSEVPLRAGQDRRAYRHAATRSSWTRRTPPRPARPRRTCASCSAATEEQELTARRGRGRRLHRRGRRPRGGGPGQGGRGPRAAGRTCPSSPSPPRRRPDPGAVRHLEPDDRQATSRSTSTRCARPSRRASSSTCSPTTRPTRRYWRIEKAIDDDPEYDVGKAKPRHRPVRVAAPAPTSPRRPRSSSSTSGSTPPHKIGGRAKAMVVTSSRLHAVRYKQAIDDYIAEQGYTDLARPGGLLRQGHRRHGR